MSAVSHFLLTLASQVSLLSGSARTAGEVLPRGFHCLWAEFVPLHGSMGLYGI